MWLFILPNVKLYRPETAPCPEAIFEYVLSASGCCFNRCFISLPNGHIYGPDSPTNVMVYTLVVDFGFIFLPALLRFCDNSSSVLSLYEGCEYRNMWPNQCSFNISFL